MTSKSRGISALNRKCIAAFCLAAALAPAASLPDDPARKLRGRDHQASGVSSYLAKKDRGRELVEDVCTYCHGLQKLQGQELSREEWRDLIKGMIFEGAPVTDEEFSLILDYLAANYGKKDR